MYAGHDLRAARYRPTVIGSMQQRFPQLFFLDANMTYEIILTIFNFLVAISIIVRFRPVFQANSFPELNRLVEHKPRVKKILGMPVTRTYWLPLVLGSISLLSIINSIPDELVEQDGGGDDYVYAAFSVIFLVTVWVVHVWRLRKVQAAPSEVGVPLPELTSEHIAKSDPLPAPLTTGSGKGTIKIVGIVIAVFGLFLIAYSLAKKGAPSAAEEKFKADFAAAVNAPLAPTPPAPAAASQQGSIDANAQNLPTALTTSAGKLSKGTLPSGETSIFLNDSALYTGENARYLSIIRQFKIAGKDVVLVASTGARGNSCESLFAFLNFEAGQAKATPLFGTCSADGTFSQMGDVITLTLPKMGGNSLYTFDGVVVKEDGMVKADNGANDLSQ
jgi:hypothetical protein